MIGAYVDGRPMPFSSSAFTSVASVKRGGGSVKCWSGVTCSRRRRSRVVEVRQRLLRVLVVFGVAAFDVDLAEAGEAHVARRCAQQVRRRLRVDGGVDLDADLIEDGVRHLAREEALPDQRVELRPGRAVSDLLRLAGSRNAEVGRIASCASCAPFDFVL